MDVLRLTNIFRQVHFASSIGVMELEAIISIIHVHILKFCGLNFFYTSLRKNFSTC